ncbi:MAG: hypothetical protein JWO33_695, partial [Caulobacteraceae bacterium]|nr:hypothetical protein [Caulobacteraceae bacterium]
MDRRRTGAAVLGLATAVALAAVAAGSGPPLRAMRWTATGGDPIPDMTEAPTECLRPASSTADALRVEVGRAAFRTPVLLGGQAARAGLTCEGCHRSGRNNPAFHFPGVSGAPGTADVTSSLFSSHRGDNLDNPKPIPDLSGPKRGLRIDQSPARPDLELFIHGLVHEEFDGPEPPAEVLAGLAAYVRALDPKACPSAATASLSSGLLMTDA